MKIKSPASKWAMALCAVAVFSFTAARDAQARLRIVGPPTPVIQPDDRVVPLEPVPAPPVGTFTGTVIVD